jgi:DNA-binding LacI/PurR family transcriptional regulator
VSTETYHRNDRGRITLRDIAERVGVSVNTASFVLNGSRSGTRVSEATRKAIWEAAAELGYTPNALARSLRQQRTNIIGLYCNFEFLQARNLFLSDLVGGLQEGCAELGYDLLLHSFGSGSTVEALRASLMDNRVDGLVFYAPPSHGFGSLLAQGPVPVVAVVDLVSEMPSVTVDDIEGGRLQAQYLAARGHRRVMYRQYVRPPVSAQRREAAFKAQASTLGMQVVDAAPFGRFREHSLTPNDLAQLRSGVTAIVCWEDNSAYGTAVELDKLGLRIPGDVEIVGFNGLRTDQPLRWEIPTVEAPWRAAGQTAIRILTDLIDGKDVPRETVLPVGFVPRP